MSNNGRREGKQPKEAPESDSDIENVTEAYLLAQQRGITLDAARQLLLQEAGTSRRHAALARNVLESPDLAHEVSRHLSMPNAMALRSTSRGVRGAMRAAVNDKLLKARSMLQWTALVKTRPPTGDERARYGIPADVKRVVVTVPKVRLAPSSRVTLVEYLRARVWVMRCSKHRAAQLEQLYWGLVVRGVTFVAAEVRRFIDWSYRWCALNMRQRRTQTGDMHEMLRVTSNVALFLLAYFLRHVPLPWPAGG